MKRKKSIRKRNIFVLGIIMVLSVFIVYATNYLSSQVRYSNNSVASKNVQDAIYEIYAAKNAGCYVGYTKGTETSTQYLCNKSSDNSSQTYVLNSENVIFDNTGTDLTSTNVKDALDEIIGKLSYCKDNYSKQNETSNSYECRINTLPSTLTVTNNSVNLTYGGSNGENTYTYNGDGTVSCSSGDTSKVTCSVDTTNHKIIVTPVAATTSAVTITVSATATANYYAPTDATFTVNVAKASGYVNLSATSGSYTYGESKQFTVSSSHGGTLTSNNNNCTISGTTVTCSGQNANSYTVRITSAETANYNSAYADYSLTVNKANGYVNLSASSGSVNCEGTSTFTVSSYHNGTLSCTSSDTSKVTCSVSGTTITVTGVAEGSAILTVTSAATTNYNAASTTYTATTGASASWHYYGIFKSTGSCSYSVGCPNRCQGFYSTSLWSCVASDSTAPSEPSLASGAYCWCKY